VHQRHVIIVIIALLGIGLVACESCPEGQVEINGVCECPKGQVKTEDGCKDKPPEPPCLEGQTYRTLAEVCNVPRGLFNYGGSTTFAPLRAPAIVTKINEAHPEFQLRYTSPSVGTNPGSGTGIKMLLKGMLSFSQSSRSVKTAEFEEAKKRSFTLDQIAVAIDGIAFYVHPELRISGITVTQAKKIFTGEITNWQAVGGPDLEIVPFSRNLEAGGTVDFFYEQIMDKIPFGPTVREVSDTTTGIREVARTPGGIGYATASEVINQQTIRVLPIAKNLEHFISPCSDRSCQAVNKTAFANDSYPITRRLFVVIKRDGTLDEQAGEAYVNLILSDEGQQLVEQAGFVPIR